MNARVDKMRKTGDDKLDQFKIDIGLDANVVGVQRDRANEDLRFINVQGGMWEGFLEDQEISDRIRLELDVVADYVHRFIGEWNMNRVGVEFIPDDAATGDDEAEIVNGIYRADFRQYGGKIAIDTAVLEAATCGFGAFKLASAFDDDGDPENDDQHIEHRPIFNAYNAVYFDQAAQWIDYRDARHCAVLKLYSFDSFDAAFPGEDRVSAYEPVDRKFYNSNTLSRSEVYVASRYDVVHRRKTFFVYRNLAEGRIESYEKADHELVARELRANPAIQFVREREVTKRVIEKTVFSGAKILKPTKEIAGEWIPVIPVFGYRTYVDGVPWYYGLVRKLKDAARLFNMQVSQMAENAAGGGQRVPIFTPEQMENPVIRKQWADKTNKAFLLADSVKDEDGNPIHQGPVGYAEPPAVDPNGAALMEVVPQYVQNVTGGAPQEVVEPRVSGKAMTTSIKRVNLNTQMVMDNIESAVASSGKIYASMAGQIYSTERVLRTLGRDGTNGSITIHQPALDRVSGVVIESNVIRGKKFRVYAESGPQYDSLREQTVDELRSIIPLIQETKGAEQYMPVLLQMLIDAITGVGLSPLKDFNRRQMLIGGLVQPETDEERAFVEKMAQQQEQSRAQDPERQLIAAATGQAQAEARNLDSASVQKLADAKKKQAETAEILAEIDQNQQRLALDEQGQVFDLLKSLPVQGGGQAAA